MLKPYWLNKKIDLAALMPLKALGKDLKLNTVCEQAGCPNIGECFSQKLATFLLLGDVCSRSCAFCGIKSGRPRPLDQDEPKRVAEAVRRLGLKTVVLTSVCRDDLRDQGVNSFIEAIDEIRRIDPKVTIETLIPDFRGDKALIRRLVRAKPDILSHNIETVKSLYSFVRSPASYLRSLDVLKSAKDFDSRIYTKSALMLGLGESQIEVAEALKDLREAGCNFLSIGQYLAPSEDHLPVKEYIDPEVFKLYGQKALSLGFDHVLSLPYARSSYKAASYLSGN